VRQVLADGGLNVAEAPKAGVEGATATFLAQFAAHAAGHDACTGFCRGVRTGESLSRQSRNQTGGRRQRPDDPLLQRAGVRVEREASGGRHTAAHRQAPLGNDRTQQAGSLRSHDRRSVQAHGQTPMSMYNFVKLHAAEFTRDETAD
jgi:hypothetical protein